MEWLRRSVGTPPRRLAHLLLSALCVLSRSVQLEMQSAEVLQFHRIAPNKAIALSGFRVLSYSLTRE
jgi:hypothetical protein